MWRWPIAAWFGLLLLLSLLSRTAAAQCGEGVTRWAQACGEAEQVEVKPAACEDGVVVVWVGVGGAPPLRVEAARGKAGAFRNVAGIGLSPLGDFPDWNREPPSTREAFDRLTACVARDPSLEIAAPPPAAPKPPPPSTPGSPWILLAAMALAASALLPSLRRSRARRAAIAMAGIAIGTAILRRWLVGPAFFHQNAHGPLWIAYARCETSPYGSGFGEIFGWAATRTAPRSEVGVFALQAALAALGPPAAWITLRRIGVRALLAWAAAFAVAIDPMLARLARSESYFGVQASLLFVATALVAEGTVARRDASVRFLAPTLAAGLVVAQAARIHPMGWVPAALLPLVHVAAPGSIRRRIRHTAIVAGLVGLEVVAISGREMIAIVGGAVGERWLPGAQRAIVGGPWAAALAVGAVGAVVLAATLRRRRSSALRLAALAAVLAAAGTTDVLRGAADYVRAAELRPFAPVLLAVVGGLLACVARAPRRARIAAAATFALATVYAVLRYPSLTALPTDALELRNAIATRDRLGEHGPIVGLARSGSAIAGLLVFDYCGAHTGKIVALEGPGAAVASAVAPARPEAEGALPHLSWFGPDALYYRSSLCSTAAGRPVCAALESGSVLDPIEETTLPARPSMPDMPYDAPEVRVGLYRVRGSARPSP